MGGSSSGDSREDYVPATLRRLDSTNFGQVATVSYLIGIGSEANFSELGGVVGG